MADDLRSALAALLPRLRRFGLALTGSAVEADELVQGTCERVLSRIGQLRESLRGTPDKKRGVLVKALKPTQDAKTDMPVIGKETVRRERAKAKA